MVGYRKLRTQDLYGPVSWDHLKAHSRNAVLTVYSSYRLSCGTLELGCLDRRRSLTGNAPRHGAMRR
jgi:hypothetical protein